MGRQDLPAIQDGQHALQRLLWARWPPGVGDEDLLLAPVQNRRDGGGPALSIFRLHGDAHADELGGQPGRVAEVAGAPVAGLQSMRPPAGERITGGRGGPVRLPTRFVPKYTLRVAHLELGWVDLALVGLEKAGIANQPGARNVGV